MCIYEPIAALFYAIYPLATMPAHSVMSSASGATAASCDTHVADVITATRMESLMTRYAAFAPMHLHLDAATGSVAPCCLQGAGTLAGVATSFTSVAETLNYAASTFGWGGHRCPFVCQALLHRAALDCGARGGMCLTTLRMSPALAAEGLRVAGVQFVRRCSPQEGVRWLAAFRAKGGDDAWVQGDVAYHQVVGLIDSAGCLTVWDCAFAGVVGRGFSVREGQRVCRRCVGGSRGWFDNKRRRRT